MLLANNWNCPFLPELENFCSGSLFWGVKKYLSIFTKNYVRRCREGEKCQSGSMFWHVKRLLGVEWTGKEKCGMVDIISDLKNKKQGEMSCNI